MNEKNAPAKEAKILNFPKQRIIRELNIDPDALTKKIEHNKVIYTDYLLQNLVIGLADRLGMEGIIENEEIFVKDFFLIVEAARSMIYRQMNLKHPIQKLNDEVTVKYIEENKDFATAPFRIFNKLYTKNEEGKFVAR